MELRTKIQSVLAKYGLSLEDEVKETEMATMQLEDGTTVHCDGYFQKGDSCYVVNEEGEKIPLPDGEYTTADGAKFTMEEGTVTASDVPAPEKEEKPAEETTTEKEEEKVESKEDEEEKMEEKEEEEMEEDEEEKKEEAKKKYSRHEMKQMVAELGAALRKEHKAELEAKDQEIKKLKAQLNKDRKAGLTRTPQKDKKPDPVKTHFTETALAAHQIFAQYSR